MKNMEGNTKNLLTLKFKMETKTKGKLQKSNVEEI